MGSPSHLAKYGSYDEFIAVYDSSIMPLDPSLGVLGLLGQALANKNPDARVAIATRLLDDGADPSLVSTSGDRVNVLHILWGRDRERNTGPEVDLIARMLNGGADINLRSPRFGLPLVMMASDALPTLEYLHAAFTAVITHSRPDLTARVDKGKELSLGKLLVSTRFGALRDAVLSYAASTGQDIEAVS